MVQTYNKAIRDRIPDIIRRSGKEVKVKILPDDEFLLEMEKKLLEEINEYLEKKSIDELVDILEVLYRVAELKGVGKPNLEKIRRDKTLSRGSFSKKLLPD